MTIQPMLLAQFLHFAATYLDIQLFLHCDLNSSYPSNIGHLNCSDVKKSLQLPQQFQLQLPLQLNPRKSPNEMKTFVAANLRGMRPTFTTKKATLMLRRNSNILLNFHDIPNTYFNCCAYILIRKYTYL